jgi:hypothetical protein
MTSDPIKRNCRVRCEDLLTRLLDEHGPRDQRSGDWETVSRALEDQQLVLDEYGFGDHGTHAAWTHQSGDRHQQMQKKDG